MVSSLHVSPIKPARRPLPGRMLLPTGLLPLALLGALLLAANLTARAQTYNPNGLTVAGGNGRGSAPNQLNGPQGVAVDGSGAVYVSDRNNQRIQKWAVGATQGVTVAGGNGFGSGPNQLFFAFGVAVDGSGAVYVADASNQRIQKWAVGATQGVTVAGGNGRGLAPNQLDFPTDVAVDGSGAVYVADSRNHRIQKWAVGATQGVTVAGGNGSGSAPNQLNFPQGVAVDGSGAVYVADRGNDRIQKWAVGATQGVTVAGGNGRGSAPNQLNGPQGVAVDGSGAVYVSDLNNDRIQKFSVCSLVSITAQPVAASSVCVGTPVRVSVSTTGSVTGYQWYQDGALVSGQTSATLSLPNTTTASTGSYSVVVTGNCNSVTSTAFTLTVTSLPTVSISPAATAVCAGQSATLTAQGATSYQWRGPAGFTSTSSTVSVSVTGTYSVTGTTSGGCSATASASVTVNPNPSVSLANNGPLTCSQTSVTLTASSGSSGTYAFAGPGGSLPSSGNQARVTQPGTYSVTLTTPAGCSATATTTVASNTTVAAPTLQASATPTTNQPISVTASGCQGTVNWLPQGGTGQANGAVYTFSQPGNYTLSATCSVGNCSSAPADPLSLSIRPGGLAITSVSMVSCQLFDAAKGEYQVRFTPQYSGANDQPITFAVLNELAPTTQPAPYQLRLYTDNPTITLVANQPGNPEARFAYEWLASCRSGGQPNQPPTTSGIPNQSIRQDQPYQLSLTDYFADPDAQPLTYSASGLPAGLNLSGSRISGTPTQPGLSTVSVTALDPGGLQVSTSFSLTVTPRPTTPTGFTITGVSLVSCEPAGPNRRQLRFTPQYAGTDATPIRFSVTNELSPTTDAGPYTLLLYTDNPVITLSAQQGSARASFRYDWLQACSVGARVGAEPGSGLQVRVLGNPASGSQVSVAIRGAEGQPLRVQLTDAAGRMVSERLIERAGAIEAQTLPVGNQPAGLLLLRVSTPTQSQTLKVLKAE